MPGTRTIWRVGFAAAPSRRLLLGVVSLVLGCDLGSKRPERGGATHTVPTSIRSAAPRVRPERGEAEAASRVPPAVAQTLRAVREQRLEIAPPTVPLQRLAFGAGRLVQARDSSVAFLDTKRGDLVAETDIGAVRAVAHGSDGALFAVGAKSGIRLEARAAKPRPFPRATFFPGCQLFGDLEEPSYFYLFYSGEGQLYRYPFDVDAGALLPITTPSPLDGCIGALTLLRDGVFVCRTAKGLGRKAARGKRSDFPWAAGFPEPFRLLPAKRLDELFAVSTAGEVVHFRLAAGLPELGRFRLPSAPYAAAANGEALAFVLVAAPIPGQARRWSVLVTDFDGQSRFRAELAAPSASADDDWLAALVEDKNLAISSFGSLVAVGGSVRLKVWDYAQGELAFEH